MTNKEKQVTYEYMFISRKCVCKITEKNIRAVEKGLKNVSESLKLISVPSRLELLYLLHQCSHCVYDMTLHTSMSQSLISHHLADLTGAGFIESKRDGKYMNYSLTDKGKKFIDTVDYLDEVEKGGEKNMAKKICDCLCDCCKKCKDCCEKK